MGRGGCGAVRGAGCGERKCVVNWDDHLSVFFKSTIQAWLAR